MPSRKQRRRRQKLQRHEYEYVVETDEGEVPLDEFHDADDSRPENGRRKDDKTPVDRRGRPIQKPTLSPIPPPPSAAWGSRRRGRWRSRRASER